MHGFCSASSLTAVSGIPAHSVFSSSLSFSVLNSTRTSQTLTHISACSFTAIRPWEWFSIGTHCQGVLSEGLMHSVNTTQVNIITVTTTPLNPRPSPPPKANTHNQSLVAGRASAAVSQRWQYAGGLLGICSILQVALKGQWSATCPPMGRCLKMEAAVPLVYSSLSTVCVWYKDRPALKKFYSCDCDCGWLQIGKEIGSLVFQWICKHAKSILVITLILL